MPEGTPDPPLLSRDELMAELEAQGSPVTVGTLENWRDQGVIPRPIRMYHNGNTRPVYPAWIVPAPCWSCSQSGTSIWNRLALPG